MGILKAELVEANYSASFQNLMLWSIIWLIKESILSNELFSVTEEFLSWKYRSFAQREEKNKINHQNPFVLVLQSKLMFNAKANLDKSDH